MKIRYKFGVWMLCLMFPALVWAENAKSICTSFTQQGRQVTFHLEAAHTGEQVADEHPDIRQISETPLQ